MLVPRRVHVGAILRLPAQVNAKYVDSSPGRPRATSTYDGHLLNSFLRITSFNESSFHLVFCSTEQTFSREYLPVINRKYFNIIYRFLVALGPAMFVHPSNWTTSTGPKIYQLDARER